MKSHAHNFIFSIIKISLSFMLLLVGCENYTHRGTDQPQLKSVWVDRILNEKICNLPCWEGITPGMTTIFEALEILQSNDLFIGLKDPVLIRDSPITYELAWQTKSDTGGGIARSVGENYAIRSIYLSLSKERPEITINEIIAHFGEPDSLIIEEDRGLCIGNLFYSEKAVTVVFSERCRKKMSVSENQVVDSIELFPLGISTFPEVEYFRSNTLEFILYWTGYGEYPITKKIQIE
ncbi:MAG: hypothetical protein FD147_431 [Chloroflexi bacterium]|nr:MAG: hypothetical protein FD147_431 [Chloroflexota bacterium]